jgi:outer membrane protein OmpA-like peptidoglycan-associated protein
VSQPNAASSDLWGEHAPSALLPLLLIAAVLATAADAHWWAIGTTRGASAPPARLVASTPAPAPAPAAIRPVIEVQPSAPPPSETQPVEKNPEQVRDCPPLFPVVFALGGVAPRFERAELLALVDWLRKHPESNLVIDGHADSSGSTAMNLSLSQRRASAMVKRFLDADLPRERITRRAFGAYSPVVGASEEAAENRRVVLSVTGASGCQTLESP